MPLGEDLVSHGRGGHGNISHDDLSYTDGEIIREGHEGDQGDGAYSAGRGGHANIGSPHVKPSRMSHDHDVVPEMAIKEADGEPHHAGRGGAGNVEKPIIDKKDHPEGLADKLKNKLLGKK